MEERISKFIEANKVFTLATSDNNEPYCASCFYAYDDKKQLLIFSSENHTNHIKQALINNKISGTINAEVTTIAKIKGIQFKGMFIDPSKEEQETLYSIYYKRFPFAKAKPAPIWAIALTWIKMTDNTLGFGKKLEWES